jgi:hypothetical protein
VYSGHLRRQNRLDLIRRLNAFDGSGVFDPNHKVYLASIIRAFIPPE